MMADRTATLTIYLFVNTVQVTLPELKGAASGFMNRAIDEQMLLMFETPFETVCVGTCLTLVHFTKLSSDLPNSP
jgi:hypothetical protein